MSVNEAWRQRSLAAVWHPCTQMKLHAPDGAALPLIPVARAEGVWLHDHEGRRYLDAISSWWVKLWGHAHPRIAGAIARQLEQFTHTAYQIIPYESVVRLAERLIAKTPTIAAYAYRHSIGRPYVYPDNDLSDIHIGHIGTVLYGFLDGVNSLLDVGHDAAIHPVRNCLAHAEHFEFSKLIFASDDRADFGRPNVQSYD